MKKITIEQACKWSCDKWSRKRILKATGGRTKLTPIEICDLDTVSVEDRIKFLLRPEIIPDQQLRWLACHWARCALENERKLGREPDPRSWRAVEVAQLYADGLASNDDLSIAWDDALDAAGGVSWDASGYAAWDAAGYAALDAAAGAAGYAALNAAWDAAWTVARDAAWSAELSGIRAMLMWLDENKKVLK